MVIYPSALAPLATLSEYPTLGESIAYQLNGLIVVFLALSSIWALMELIGFFFRQHRTAPVPAAKPAPSLPPPALVPGAGPSHEIVAAITAAISAVMEEPYRITAIISLEQARDWAREGRREIFASHKTR
jgi:Na+-transporting methylmalonyl-CoA/oxaloacetate decarboxylase gamma subunit